MALKKEQKYRSWVEIDLDNFANNIKEVKRLIGRHTDFMPAIKADAYGHGAIEISRAALENGAKMLGVANADEGAQLRISGIEAPIVILGPSTEAEIDQIIKYGLTPSISEFSFARKLSRAVSKSGRNIPIHIEVDTGMGRSGIMHDRALDLVKKVVGLTHIELEGIFSHFSSSERNVPTNERQWRLFSCLLEEIHREGISIPIKHIENSGAILNYPDFKLNMVRPGLMIYGVFPRGK